MQSVYNFDMEIGFEGGLVDLNPSMIKSYVAVGAVPFGRCVALNGADGLCKVPSAKTDKIVGVSLMTHADNYSGEGYLDKDVVSVLRKGVVWVKCETNVNAEDLVYVRAVAGVGGSVLGLVRNSAVTDETIAINAKFLTSASAGKLAQVSFDIV